MIRPPSEAGSYILQVTYGCSHNRCTFCGTYLDKPFRPREIDPVLADIQLAGSLRPDMQRVFLADGDAMVLSTNRLVTILDALRDAFPNLERVGIYANAQNLQSKSIDDLETLYKRGLGIVYLGLESGSDDVLKQVEKGTKSKEMIEAVQKAKSAGMLVSVIGILGLAGQQSSSEHAEKTGQVVSQMDPDYFSMLTLMLVPGTKLYHLWHAGEFQLLEAKQALGELRKVIETLTGLTRCVFRTNHASNYLSLGGTLPEDKVRLLKTLDLALAHGKDVFRPDAWRGL